VFKVTSEKVIKEAVKAGKVLIGRNAVIRSLKRGSLESLFCASNCPSGMIKELEHYTGISKIELQHFKGDSTRLGQLCGKPFNITVLGVKK
jgi:large subunit ribosomal protein L30e